MTGGHLLAFLRQLRHRADIRETAALSDRQLLERYALAHDESAFAALLQRHGGMVWGVCRRVLSDTADAEDAFQATFLVLIHKAATLRNRESLAAWLQGVAWRLARRVKADAARRRIKEGRVEREREVDLTAELERRDLRTLLDEELDRLPEKYRSPLVLCYLEGLSYTEAAQRLGWRDGTVCGRLARAREILRQRLNRRGLTLSVAALAAPAEPTAAPAALVTAAAKMAALFALGQTAGSGAVSATVAALAQGVLHSMSLAKLKTVVALGVIVCLFAAGTGWTAHWVLAIASGRKEQPAPHGLPGRDTGADAKRGTDVKCSLRGHRDRITSVAYAPDGRWFATASWDGTIHIWDAQTGKETRRLDVPATKEYKPAHLSQIMFSPDNRFVVVAQNSMPNEPGVIVWDRRTGERVRDFPGLCAAIAPDGKQIACGGWGTQANPNRGDIRLYEFATGKLVRVIHTPYSHIHRLTFASDGQLLFGQVAIPRPPLGNGLSRMGLDPVEVRAWDAATGKERRTRLDGWGGFVPIAFSPDGRTFALAHGLWEVATGESRVELKGHTQEVCAVAFAPDGRTAATGSMDGTVRVWELPSGKEIARFGKEVPRFSGGWVLAIAFSPDGRTLVSGGLDKFVYVWDVSRITGRRREPAERSPADLEADWRDLSGNAAAGYAAVGRLRSSPKTAVAFLEKQLQRTKPVDNKRIERLLADLDDEQFAVREQAVKQLEALAENAAPALRKALAGKPPLEVRRRLQALLERLNGAKLLPETIRQIRAVEALEAIGTSEARRLLDKLAAGSPETRLAQEARAAAGRLLKRASVAP